LLQVLFHTEIGVISLLALIATIGVGIGVTILVITKVLRASEEEPKS